MTAANPFPESLLKTAQEQKVIATQQAEEKQSLADKAKRIQKLWEDITKFVNNGWTLHLLNLIDKEKSLLKEMQGENHPDIEKINEFQKIAKEAASQIKFYLFPRELEEACTLANLPLDRDSPHPNYKFEKGFFQLYIDDHKKTARLSNSESTRLCEIPADIGAIIEVVQREHKRVFDRTFDSKKVLKKLRNHYLAIVKAQKCKDGDSISIRHITSRLGKNEKGFRTDEFLIDLSLLVEKGEVEIDGWKIDFQQSKDTSQGMYLHIEPRRYIDRVIFKKV